MTGRISSYCTWGNCCAVAPAPGGVYMFRKVTGDAAPTARLLLTTAEFRAFVQGVKAGEFDDLIGEEPVRPPHADLFPAPPQPAERIRAAGSRGPRMGRRGP